MSSLDDDRYMADDLKIAADLIADGGFETVVSPALLPDL